MPDFEPIAPLIPIPRISKDEPTGRFRRPVIPSPDDKEDQAQEDKPTSQPPRKPAEDGHIDEHA
jgi:hypothetical protein